MSDNIYHSPILDASTLASVETWLANLQGWINDYQTYGLIEPDASAPVDPVDPVDPVESAPALKDGDVTVGDGPDSMVLKVSETHYGDANAQFTVTVDGQPIGDVFSATALRGEASNTITLKGDWGPGEHQLAVRFINDAWSGDPLNNAWSGDATTDRNLHVESVSYNGMEVAGSPLYGNSTAKFAVGKAQVSGKSAEPAPTGPEPSEPAPTGIDLDTSKFKTEWVESFDNGVGHLSRAWGDVDTSVSGQITVWAKEENGFGPSADGGAMVPPTGPEAGYGYGLYSFTVEFEDDLATGGYALLWPGTDVWPGPELDVVELDFDGNPYSAIHWKGENGSDRGVNEFKSNPMGGFDPAEPNTYSMEWAEDHISVYVNGVHQYTQTDNVPKDFAHGGQNSAPGVGIQTFWSQEVQNGDNFLTAYEVSYASPVESGGDVVIPTLSSDWAI